MSNGRTAVGIPLATRIAIIWILTCGASVSMFMAYLFSCTTSVDWWLPGLVIGVLLALAVAQVWLAWRLVK